MKMLIVGFLVLSAYSLIVMGFGHMFPSLTVVYSGEGK